MHELTLLQHYEKQLNVIVDRTAKCHLELAGEGIEYAWGLLKMHYRQSPYVKKCTKEKFISLLRECTSKKVLTIERIRSLSRRAREYMLAYKALSSTGAAETGGSSTYPLSHGIIERAIKQYKSHRNSLDTDNAFLQLIIKKEDEVDTAQNKIIEEVVRKMRSINHLST